MIFNWEDGFFQERSVGDKLIGMIRNQKRPETVTLNYAELRQLISRPTYAGNVVNALNYKPFFDKENNHEPQ